jgi:hypothetical protein
MNLPKNFEHYLGIRVVRKVSIDKPRANFLINESDISLEGLKERIKIIGINDKNSNSIIKDCYDIIMEKLRARMLLEGFHASGNFAHEAEVSFLKKLNFPESEVSFLNDLRYFRNSVTYYGKLLDKEYAQKVYEFLNKIIPRLKF